MFLKSQGHVVLGGSAALLSLEASLVQHGALRELENHVVFKHNYIYIYIVNPCVSHHVHPCLASIINESF